ncbi:MAG: hypothetical protein JOZ47_11250 [Kutzneria sp.]|nr:hypothetical protein [Kutzneria sp.]MBV9845637.1 hypothetical protein [Kutzneria sp.]
MNTDTPWRRGKLLPVGGPRVLFGWGYEDPQVELASFPRCGRVLVIAAAGETAAALAGAGHEVTAVDINPAQLAYCRSRLSGGGAVTGSVERILAAGRRVLGAVDPEWRDQELPSLLCSQDPSEWRRRLASPALRVLLAAGLGPARGLAVLSRPGFGPALPPRLDKVVLDRLRRGVAKHGSATNPWAWRLFAGRELPGHEPMTGVDTGAVHLVHADVADHLASVPAGHYDAVSLSNVLDGPSSSFQRRVIRAVRHAVRRGGVVALRSLRTAADPGAAGEDRSMLWGVIRVEPVS